MDPGCDSDLPAPHPAGHLPLLRYDPLRDRWGEVPATDRDLDCCELNCVTFNAWFQGPEPAMRYAGLLDVLEEADADVILLQEATEELLAAAQSSRWVRSGYALFRSPFRADGLPSHGLLSLTRLDPSKTVLHPLPTHMGRSLLVMTFRLNGAAFAFATAHFESMRPYSDVRALQLAKAFEVLEPLPHALLAGDFNFCSSWPDENARLDPRYVDAWPAVHRGEAGYTVDTERNAMLAKARRESKQVRYDRILLRSGGAAPWRVTSSRLLGTAPVRADRQDIYPSDHFGVAATLRRD